ncbi:VOC family protein [Pseudomonas sp. LS44]|uniref:VOC family protein n=1 Tax=Pseudomonas sp. LS44 TaxID=1357074 RepID=UPI00215A892C|nr:VOC family protein [Pseudomonas sp. LS44]UVE16973.1 VOC family protein [Pseudomonas sp. LS44]
MQVEPYLFFNGRCEEAMAFYGKAIGAKTSYLMRFKEAPEAESNGSNDPEKIMHANLQIGANQIMCSDGMNEGPTNFAGFSLSIAVTSPEQAKQLFDALADGGQVTMPLQQTFWAKSFGMLVDRFGVPWMINCEQ